MDQSIEVLKVDEFNDILDSSDLNFALIYDTVVALEGFSVDFPWIANVDPYGATFLNYLQVVALAEELASLNLVLEDLTVREEIDRTLEFIEDTSSGEFVKLLGISLT